MTSILDIFNPQVTKVDGTVTVTYCHLNYSGTCVYKEHNMIGINKPIRQRFYTLQSSDMGDVIEYIYQQVDLLLLLKLLLMIRIILKMYIIIFKTGLMVLKEKLMKLHQFIVMQ